MVSWLEHDDVARHHVRRGFQDHRAVPQELRGPRKELSQRGERSFDPILLPERKRAAHEDHNHDGVADLGHALPGVAPLGDKRQRGGHPENQGEELNEFSEQAEPRGLPRVLRHDIEAVFTETSLGFE